MGTNNKPKNPFGRRVAIIGEQDPLCLWIMAQVAEASTGLFDQTSNIIRVSNGGDLMTKGSVDTILVMGEHCPKFAPTLQGEPESPLLQIIDGRLRDDLLVESNSTTHAQLTLGTAQSTIPYSTVEDARDVLSVQSIGEQATLRTRQVVEAIREIMDWQGGLNPFAVGRWEELKTKGIDQEEGSTEAFLSHCAEMGGMPPPFN